MLSYRQIRPLIYVLHFEAPLPLLQWQSGTEHIYSDYDRRDIGLIAVANHLLRQLKVVCLKVEVIQSQITSVELVTMQDLRQK